MNKCWVRGGGDGGPVGGAFSEWSGAAVFGGPWIGHDRLGVGLGLGDPGRMKTLPWLTLLTFVPAFAGLVVALWPQGAVGDGAWGGVGGACRGVGVDRRGGAAI